MKSLNEVIRNDLKSIGLTEDMYQDRSFCRDLGLRWQIIGSVLLFLPLALFEE